jgi:uncharacterized protein (TIGR02996 family)
MKTDDQRKAFLQVITANQGDASYHLVFHDWLLEQGDEQAARQQAWMAKVLLGQVQHEIIFNREGVVPQASTAWEGIRLSTRTHFLQSVRELITSYPDVQFIVVTSLPPSWCGFRRENGSRSPGDGHSPILYYRRGVGHVCRVVVKEPPKKSGYRPGQGSDGWS